MGFKFRFALPARVALAGLAGASLLLGCGGGSSSGDVNPAQSPGPPAVVAVNAAPNIFLLFPNPQLQADGTIQTNTVQYTNSYYQAIDPTNAKDTFAKWKTANGFDSGTGTQVTNVFGDTRDLGYGRNMTSRVNTDGTSAFFVANYQVGGYGYSDLNLTAAIDQDPRWNVSINAIEFSPGPNGGVAFAKFFQFDPSTGARAVTVALDDRGEKAMPGPCITCHGGRGDALEPVSPTGLQAFPLVRNGASLTRGDVQAHLMPVEVDSLAFSTIAGYARSDEEATLKQLNQMVLCSYPLPAPSSAPEDTCRRAATSNEWQGTSAALLKSAYGGDGLPNAMYHDQYVPDGWATAGQTTLYQNVIAPACRTCHEARGTGNQSDLDFTSYAKFEGYSDRIKAHVIDRGNMPLVELVFNKFWSSAESSAMADWLATQGYTTHAVSGAILQPGRPVADAGPDRVVPVGSSPLSAAMSLYASTYQWSIVSGPAGATLSSASGSTTSFVATNPGTYVVQLIASSTTASSAPANLTLVVSTTLPIAPSAIRFADIKAVLQGNCVTCHTPGNTPLPPIFYTDFDRNGDGNIDATDDQWFYTEVRSRINFTDYVASPLLRKPSGHHHNGLLQPGFDTSTSPGDPARANYDLFLNWILNGAPQ